MSGIAASASRLAGLFGEFLAWWQRELKALVPAALRRALASERRWTVLDLSGKAPALWRCVGGRESELAAEGSLDEAALIALLRRRRHRGRVVLRIPTERVLRRRLELPLAARDDLARLLAFEMDRLTPFKAKEVRFGHRILATDPAARRLTVEFEVAPREVVDAALERARRLGVWPARIEAGGEIDFAQDDGRAGGRHSRLDLTLAGLALLLATIAAYLPLERQRAGLVALQSELALVRAEAEAAMALRDEVARHLVDRDRVLAQRLATPLAVAVLKELTTRLPDHSYALEVTLHSGEIHLQGYSEAASELIALLEASELLARAQFRSPVTRDPRIGRERFNLSAEILKGHD
jgi:general secretion pathway protein L